LWGPKDFVDVGVHGKSSTRGERPQPATTTTEDQSHCRNGLHGSDIAGAAGNRVEGGPARANKNPLLVTALKTPGACAKIKRHPIGVKGRAVDRGSAKYSGKSLFGGIAKKKDDTLGGDIKKPQRSRFTTWVRRTGEKKRFSHCSEHPEGQGRALVAQSAGSPGGHAKMGPKRAEAGNEKR